MSTICAKYRRCLLSFARRGSIRSSGIAIRRTCAAPIPAFSGARSNLTSETLWIICALPRKVSSGSPTFMLMCSQRNIAARSALVEGHPERHSIVDVARSLLGVELTTQFARAGLLGSVDGLRKIMERRRGGDRLFGPDVGCPDHLAPLLGFLCDQLAEVGGRARERCAAQIGEARAHERHRHRSWIV